MGGLRGNRNGRWSGGVHTSDKGYRRISHGDHRDKYEHRYVMEQLLLAPVGLMYYPCCGDIPGWATVHHQDHNRQHNCPGNLILVDRAIHSALSKWRQRYILDNYEAWLEYERERGRWD